MWKFLGEESGNVALTFVLMAFVILGITGGAIDYSRVVNVRSDYQDAADAAAIAAAIESKKESWDKSRKLGLDYLDAQSPLNDSILITSKDITKVNDEIIATVRGASQNSLLSAFGFGSFDFEVKSVVKLPDYPIEVAMVLDNTFSMSVDGKIGALKTTAREFVDTLLDHDLSDVKISIVPFAQYVNVGPGFLGASWLEAQNEIKITPRQCSMQQDVVSKSGCRTEYTNHPARDVPEQCSPAKYNDGVLVQPASCTPASRAPAHTTSQEVCSNVVHGAPYEVCTPETRQTIYWNGCVASRANPLNTNDNDYSRKVPGPNQLTCPSPITPLTDDKNRLRNAINGMVTVGDTYIPQGVVWGYRTLTNRVPFDQALSDGIRTSKDGRRFLIVMTDGINTKSPEYTRDVFPNRMDVGLHTGSDRSVADDLTLDTCQVAKSDDIEIFTVSFGNGVDATTKAMMQSCASKNDNYFDAATNNDLVATFESIADRIVTVYLAE
ncbi:MAG: pilus assembly protein TadG-related protein [Pseudomonadota bacterium]